MMANYRYEPDILSKRKQIARTENTVPLTPAFAARYTARLAELGKPFKLGKRTALPTEPVVTDAPQEVGNTLMLSAEQHPRAALRSWQGLVAATKSAAPNLDEHAR
jgi:hypothetical protein